MKPVLKKIRDFAAKAHGTQQRKYTPEPYIVHPERVMKLCEEYTDDVCVLASALLHDVLEDTPVTKTGLHEFLGKVMNEDDADKTLKLVVELTDVYIKEDYPKLNRRRRKAMEQDRMALTSRNAQTVKYADIVDNCREIVLHDPSFAKVFLYECRALLKRMDQGNPKLYKMATEMVDYNIERLKKLKNKS